MAEKIHVTLANNKTIPVKKGITVKELVQNYYLGDEKVLAANVDNKLRTLDFELSKNCNVTFSTYSTSEGRSVYRRSLAFLLVMTVREMWRNGRLQVHHSLSNAFYYDLKIDIPLNEQIVNQIKDRMKEYIKMDIPYNRQEMSKNEAVELFKGQGYPDKSTLLENTDVDKIALYSLKDYTDINYGPLVPSTGYLDTFDIQIYHQGFRLCFPDLYNSKKLTPMTYHTKLFQIHQESKHWSKILGITNVARLNEIINRGDIADYIKINEVFHEKKISHIADEITSRSKDVRIVLIAGPSSSGKTTFSKRLKIHLEVNGLSPVTISLDDYFVNREDNPKDDEGNYDFESIYSLDLDLLNKHMVSLLKGEEVMVPKFDFTHGRRKNEGEPLRISENQIIIIEGIHGLNDELTRSVESKNKFKIYISPLTQLCIDDYNRISTTDCRLLRRIVRDHQFRNYPAVETLNRWYSVRRGEERNIFPFQESGDVMFNSALFYEIPVLKKFAEPLLKAIPREEPMFTKADSLLKFLSLFKAIDGQIDEIPPTSILKEFIGGSSFKY
jgi:uridine kinase